MKKRVPTIQKGVKHRILPLVVQQDEDGVYAIECPVLRGCYTQGKTLDEALQNIEEVIAMILEDEKERAGLREWVPQTISFHTITVKL